MTKTPWQVFDLGREKNPVVVIEAFSPEPDALRAAAASQKYRSLGPFYPGIRAPAPGRYLAERMDLITEIFHTVFGVTSGLSLIESAFSLVTTPPEKLQPIQCLPHYDTTSPERFAFLHYLSEARTGGTNFFRHRATGFESISDARFEGYKKTLEEEARTYGLPPKAYFVDESPQFEKIGSFEAAFNRMLIYRGNMLHSGAISNLECLKEDPRQGRLTINSFLHTRPA